MQFFNFDFYTLNFIFQTKKAEAHAKPQRSLFFAPPHGRYAAKGIQLCSCPPRRVFARKG